MAGQKQIGHCIAVVYPFGRSGEERRLNLYEYDPEKAKGEAVRKWRQIGLRSPGWGLAIYVRDPGTDTHHLFQSKHGYSKCWDDRPAPGLVTTLPERSERVYTRPAPILKPPGKGGGIHAAVIYHHDRGEVERFPLTHGDRMKARQEARNRYQQRTERTGYAVAVYEFDAEQGGPPVFTYLLDGNSIVWELSPAEGLSLVLPPPGVSAFQPPDECRAMRARRVEEGRRRLLGRFAENARVSVE